MNANAAIAQFVRWNREQLGMTQQELAARAGITYQYLSTLESGKNNITLDVVENIGKAMNLSFPRFVIESYFGPASKTPPLRIDPAFFRRNVPLPPRLTAAHLEGAMNETQRLVHLINAMLTATGGEPLSSYIQANNFSGIVSNILCNSLHRCSPYKHYSAQKHPDLMCFDRAGGELGGLEVKATTQLGKGGESHNGHSGWHLIAHFTREAATGGICFRHLMIADLIGHTRPESDWKYLGSKVKEDTGSQRTETYSTTAAGTAKLRHGSVFLDPTIDFRRWRRPHADSVPHFSIFHPPVVRKPKKRR